MTYNKLSDKIPITQFKILQSECHVTRYIAIFSCVILMMWAMIAVRKFCDDNDVMSVEERILAVATQVVNESDVMLNTSLEILNQIKLENDQLYQTYMDTVEERINDKKKDNLRRMKDIMTKSIADIQTEISQFNEIIDDAVRGIFDYLIDDTGKFVKYVNLTVADNATKTIPIALDEVEYSVTGAFVDLENMYSYYKGRVLDFINERAQNGTRKISLLISSNRKYDATFSERLRLCYRISSQNSQVVDQINHVLEVVSTILNGGQIVADLNNGTTSVDGRRNALLSEAELALNREFFKGNYQLKSTAENKGYFLGSLISERSPAEQNKMNDNILRHTRKCTLNYSESVNATMNNFTIARDGHWTILKERTDTVFANLKTAVQMKLPLLNDAKLATEFEEKLKFDKLRSWMETKYQNCSQVVDHGFEWKKWQFYQELKDNMIFFNNYIVPVMSILSLDNYIPQECPITINFQRFVRSILSAYLDDSCAAVSYSAHEECVQTNKPDSDSKNPSKMLTQPIPVVSINVNE